MKIKLGLINGYIDVCSYIHRYISDIQVVLFKPVCHRNKNVVIKYMDRGYLDELNQINTQAEFPGVPYNGGFYKPILDTATPRIVNNTESIGPSINYAHFNVPGKSTPLAITSKPTPPGPYPWRLMDNTK